MEGNGRKLAWVAIALSVVALMVSIGGRAQSRWQGYNGPRGFDAPYSQQGPQGQFGPMGPQGQFGRHGQMGPQGQFGQQGQQGQFGRHGQMGPQDQFGPQGRFERGHFGRMPFFFLPFMLFGGLLKLLFVGFLIWMGLRLIKGRGFGGPWGRGRGDQDPPSRPGPEQPPYTGDTHQV